MGILHQLFLGLRAACLMFWQIFWALSLGFFISATVQAVVPKGGLARLLPNSGLKSLSLACGLGAASSSCSYAAVAIARSLFVKGADFTAAIVFEFASTNLVLELGILLWVFMGWQFAAAEISGGVLMIMLIAWLFKFFLSKGLVEKAKAQAEKNLPGMMEGHARMDMSLKQGSIFSKLFSKPGFTAASHYFIMDIVAVYKDIILGLILAGCLSAWVSPAVWQNLFLHAQTPLLKEIWGALVGPLVAMLSFVCSVGNVPLAAVLWNGGISFGGVVAFIFADLIILPILNIYRKYYGLKVSAFLLATSYVAMAIAGFLVSALFKLLNLIPTGRNINLSAITISFNYTAWLNIVFLLLAGVLTFWFFKTDGQKMLKMMH